MFSFDIQKASWIFEPKEYTMTNEKVIITTEPQTDFWQRTYYGFQNDNAPALLITSDEKYFSFTVKTDFNSKSKYDQCGVMIYQDSDNWFKASIEYENDVYARLGSVVTNHGYSDWASTDVGANVKSMYYRLSRRESDFCIENSLDGKVFQQMRIFHLFEGNDTIQFGLYACSPSSDASFQASFSEIGVTECLWEAHSA
jgi:hypothetical protein